MKDNLRPDPEHRERLRFAIGAAMVDPNYPSDDVKDTANGARFTPNEVTLARRDGQPVNFMQACSNPCCWYWEFHDAQPAGDNRYKPGQRIYHFDRASMEALQKNHAGKCPACGNTQITGERTHELEKI